MYTLYAHTTARQGGRRPTSGPVGSRLRSWMTRQSVRVGAVPETVADRLPV